MSVLAQTAQQSNPSYLIPIVTVAVSGVVALIVGFGAAALKHRWDVQDSKIKHQWDVDDTERLWERERVERRREEVQFAFNDYLANRVALEHLLLSTDPTQLDIDNVTRMIRTSGHRVEALRTILSSDDANEVGMDETAFMYWADEMLRRMEQKQLPLPLQGAGPEKQLPDAPSAEAVRRLAKRILDA